MEQNSGYYIACFMVSGLCLLGWIIIKYFQMNKQLEFKQPKQTIFGFVEVNDDMMFKSNTVFGKIINPVEIPQELYKILGPLTFSHYSALFGTIQHTRLTNPSLNNQYNAECRLLTVAAYLFKFSIPAKLVLIDETTIGYYLHFTKKQQLVQILLDNPTFLKENYTPSIKEITFNSLFKAIPQTLEICEKYLNGESFPSKAFLLYELKRNRVVGSPEAIDAVLTLAFGLGGFRVPESYVNVSPMVLDAIYILNNPDYFSKVVEENKPRLSIVK